MQPGQLLHNNTASLLQLAHDLGQEGIDDLLDLVLLLGLLLLLLLSTGVVLLLSRIGLLGLRRVLVSRVRGHDSLATSQVHVDATGVLLSSILQAQLLADLLDTGLDLLHVVRRVVALSDDTKKSSKRSATVRTPKRKDDNHHIHMQMVLSMRLRILNPLLKDLLRLLNELSMQINGVRLYTAIGIILPENELRRLLVVLLHLAPMRLALLGEVLGRCAIAARVRFLGLKGVSYGFAGKRRNRNWTYP